ncbi:hypothetical protein GCM10011360_00120 [Primorskyibacter flagellatus]|uniref:Helix-turn-helix domain-containing protein n=1 Tax=Primorskyibacter flagellatus TaxID=1387277 RepID=A0A917E9Z5_9RHOB|nr:hypothetical protein GCM10011360_00120 [Primorskyibacter flagellatus]
MSRSYRNVRTHDTMVYSVDDVQALFGVHRNTVSNWVVSGLKPSDDSLPQRFRGAELKRFHADRAERARRNLRLGEFKCIACGNAVFPELGTLSLTRKEGHVSLASATCCDCGASLFKLLGATECDYLQECLDTNTSSVPRR